MEDEPEAPPALDVTTPAGEKSRPPPAAVRRGESFGRYLVLDLLGRGGMGTVFAAYDPELDRKVALKVWAGATDAGDRHERLLSEAKALGKLNHANVVTVFDVGEREDAVYMAMELVHGGTLAQWLAQEPRDRSAVLDVFVDAARGLAAAHSEGLSHGDFKPSNVLMTTRGRAKVADFGLARRDLVTSGPRAAPGQAGGTPKYMAPEVHAGHPADHRSDQYAYCVALFEALAGRDPFADLEPSELAAAKARGLSEAPRGLPRELRGLLRRGLHPEPDDRFDSMDALLRVIDRQRSVVARRRWLVAAGTLAVAGVAVLAFDGGQRCENDETPWQGLWDEGARDRLEGAAGVANVPYAGLTGERVAASLDDFVLRWSSVRQDACLAAVGEHDPLYARRLQCLGRRRDEVGKLLELLGVGEASVWERAVFAAERLSPPEECLSELGVGTHLQPPQDAETQNKVDGIRDLLAEVRVLEHLGLYDDGLERLEQPAQEVETLGYGPVRAEVLLRRGRLLEARGEAQPALEVLKEAHWLAEGQGHHEVAAEAGSLVVFVLAAKLGRFEPADDWYQHAKIAVERVGLGGHHEAELQNAAGVLAMQRGDFDDAQERLERALVLKIELYGERHHQVAIQAANLGILLERLGRYEEAQARYEQAFEIYEDVLGEAHPRTAGALYELGVLAMHRGEVPRCIEIHERALGIKRKVLPASHPSIAYSLDGLGMCLRDQGQLQASREHHEEALAILNEAYGDGHLAAAGVANDLGNTLRELGAVDEAVTAYRRSLEVMIAGRGESHPDVAAVLNSLAGIAGDREAWEAAVDYFTRARKIMVESLGEGHPSVIDLDANLGTALAMLGRHEASATLLDAALQRARTAWTPKHPRVATVMEAQGTLAEQSGDLRGAVRWYEKAYAIRREHTDAPLAQARTGYALSQGLAALGDRDQAVTVGRESHAAALRAGAKTELAGQLAAWLRDLPENAP